MSNPTDTNQASVDEPQETIERLLRFNCPNGCDGHGTYPEMSSDGEWDQGQCQWCFEYGMQARDAIQSLIRTEKLKLLAEVREQAQSMPIHGGTDSCSPSKYVQAVSIDALTKLEAEL